VALSESRPSFAVARFCRADSTASHGANVAKQRIYSVHLPHLIDEYQSLEASAVKQLEDDIDGRQRLLRLVDRLEDFLPTLGLNLQHPAEQVLDLVDLDGANVAKQRIYSVHLPHLIDEYQSLEASDVVACCVTNAC
jgi:hypothetical protein